MTDAELLVRMALAGLGGGNPVVIGEWPLHYWRAIRREYFKIIAPAETESRDPDPNVIEIG